MVISGSNAGLIPRRTGPAPAMHPKIYRSSRLHQNILHPLMAKQFNVIAGLVAGYIDAGVFRMPDVGSDNRLSATT
jgi:hypothetical protein